MKSIRLYFALVVSILNINCGQTASADKTATIDNFAEIKFEKENIEIGKIEAKKIASVEYKFWNTGNIPLNITYAKGACHCVQPKWPDNSIAPGDSSVITVTFDPEDVTGFFQRTLTVQSNAKKKSVDLVFTGEIITVPKNKTGPSAGNNKK